MAVPLGDDHSLDLRCWSDDQRESPRAMLRRRGEGEKGPFVAAFDPSVTAHPGSFTPVTTRSRCVLIGRSISMRPTRPGTLPVGYPSSNVQSRHRPAGVTRRPRAGQVTVGHPVIVPPPRRGHCVQLHTQLITASGASEERSTTMTGRGPTALS